MAALDPGKDPARRCLPVPEWPDPDRAAWNAALDRGDIFGDGGLACRWSEATRRTMASAYGRWLTHIKRQGALDPDAAPEDRVRPERVRAYIEELQATVAPVTVHGRIRALKKTLRVMVPGADLGWLRRTERRLAADAVPVRDKEQKLRNSAELFGLGIRLMERAEGDTRAPANRRALRYRDGALIAFLAARPLRRRTFAGMRIGRNLTRLHDHYVTLFEAADTKGGRLFEVPLPHALTPYIDRYLLEHRLVLLKGRRSDRVWITHMGTAMTAGSVYVRIRNLTERELGVAINPHLFRDCLATSLIVHDPENVRTAAALLGHASLETTNRHYNQAKALEAVGHYQQQICRLRRRLLDAGNAPPPSGGAL